MARITNADLFAALTDVTAALVALNTRVTVVEGQFSTPAPVLTIVQDKPAKVATTGKRPLAGAALAKHEAKVAREAGMTPAQVAKTDQAKAQEREAKVAAYKANKGALAPLNKALHAAICASGIKSGSDAYKAAWADRLSNPALMAAAGTALTPAERKAAQAALTSK